MREFDREDGVHVKIEDPKYNVADGGAVVTSRPSEPLPTAEGSASFSVIGKPIIPVPTGEVRAFRREGHQVNQYMQVKVTAEGYARVDQATGQLQGSIDGVHWQEVADSVLPDVQQPVAPTCTCDTLLNGHARGCPASRE
jgi:hypothetical protein